MCERVESQFRVKEVANGDVFLLDRARGLTVAVEVNCPSHDAAMKRQIRALTAGDIIRATLQGQNQLNTEWSFEELYVLAETTR